MAVQAQSIVDRVRTIIQETTPGGRRWLDAELLQWISDGQRQTVMDKPEAGSVNTTMPCVAGTLQSIPSDGILLLKVVRNVNANDTPSKAITITDIDIFDNENPDWHDSTSSYYSGMDISKVAHYMFDENDPLNFYVYPPQPDATDNKLNIIYSKSPTDVTALTDNIGIPDIYLNTLVDYVLFRAYQKDTNYAGNQQRSVNHYQLFKDSLGKKSQVEFQNDPNMKKDMNKGR